MNPQMIQISKPQPQGYTATDDLWPARGYTATDDLWKVRGYTATDDLWK